MKILNVVGIVIGAVPFVCNAAELDKDYPQIGSAEIQAVFEPDYQAHSWYADFLKSYEIPQEIRSAINVPPFYASSVVPELHFLWLRYFAALDYDNPQKRELAKAKFQHALELLEKDKKEGAAELWKNAWNDGNPDAYLKLQEIFKEQEHWCRILSHFPKSESDMMKKIQEARKALDFFYGSVEDSEKLNLKVPHISIAFARFAEAKFISALESPHNSVGVENSIRHLLQGVHVHYRPQWTQEKIGNKFGVSQASVSNFLRGNPCPELADNVRKYYEEHPDFYFFEPRKKSGWGISWSFFLPWGSSEPKKSHPEEELSLTNNAAERKRE